MNLRLTGVLAVVLLLIGGYYYLFEVRGTDERARARFLATRLLPLGGRNVTRLTLTFGDSTVVLERRAEGWAMLQPVRTQADQGEVENLLRNLSKIANEQVVADSVRFASGEVSRADFGLESPEAAIAAGYADGRSDTLYWGGVSPTGGYRYVRRSGSSDVMTAHARSRRPLERGVYALREKRVVAVEPDSVRKVQISYGDTRLEVSRESGTWEVLTPVRDLGDVSAIERLIRRLSRAKALDFAAEEVEDLAAFGLATPRLTVTAYEGERLEPKRVHVGGRVGPQRYPPSYARNPDRRPVFIVDSTFVSDMMKTASDLRNKLIFGFPLSGIDSLHFTKANRILACHLDSVQNDWVVDEPKLHIALPASVDAFINRVRGLRAEAFVSERLGDPARWGLDRPVSTVGLWRQGKPVREIRLGLRDRRVFATTDHRPEVVEIDAKDLLALDLNLIPVVPSSAADTIRMSTKAAPTN